MMTPLVTLLKTRHGRSWKDPSPSMHMKVAVVWDAWLNQCLLRNCSSVGLIGDSLEKTLMLGKIEGGRRRGQQRM